MALHPQFEAKTSEAKMIDHRTNASTCLPVAPLPACDPLLDGEFQEVIGVDLKSVFFDLEVDKLRSKSMPAKFHDADTRKVALTDALAGLLNDLEKIERSGDCPFDSMLSPIEPKPMKRSLVIDAHCTTKKPKFESILDNELHMLCCKPGVTVAQIQDAIARDPTAPSRKVQVPTNKKVYNPVTRKLEIKRTFENYKLPINLAIRHKASLDVITTLLAAAPGVTDQADGLQHETSLHIMLKHSPRDVKAVDALLLHNPQPNSPIDRQHNTVVHTACKCGASLSVVRHLIIMFPDALLMRNFHNESCAELAQRKSVMCSSEVASYVLQQTNKVLKAAS